MINGVLPSKLRVGESVPGVELERIISLACESPLLHEEYLELTRVAEPLKLAAGVYAIYPELNAYRRSPTSNSNTYERLFEVW